VSEARTAMLRGAHQVTFISRFCFAQNGAVGMPLKRKLLQAANAPGNSPKTGQCPRGWAPSRAGQAQKSGFGI